MRHVVDRIGVVAPCSADWELMRGDDRIRFCTHCSLEVHNFSAMTRREIQSLVARSNGRLCARYVRTPRGIRTLDEPPPRLVTIARRAGRIAATPLAVAMTLASASAAPSAEPSDQVVAAAPAAKPRGPAGALRGTIRDEEGNLVVGATVTLSRDGVRQDTTTNELGEYRFGDVPEGSYQLSAHDQDSRTGEVEQVTIVPGGTQFQDVALDSRMAIGGAIAFVSPAYAMIDYSKEMEARGGEETTPKIVDLIYELDTVEEAIATGAYVDERSAFGETALMTFSDDVTVKALLAAGADPNAADDFGVTPLLEAAARSGEDAVRLLLSAGASVHARDIRGHTALMLAAANGDDATVALLLEAGADVNARSSGGRTALSFALEHEQEETVALLRVAGGRE
jgi:hypothetical protein